MCCLFVVHPSFIVWWLMVLMLPQLQWLLVAIHLFLMLSVTMQGMGFRFCLNEKYPCPLIMAFFTQTDTKKMTVQACEFEMFRRVTLRYLFLM